MVATLNLDELKSLLEVTNSKLKDLKKLDLNVDMTRGKPSFEQIRLSRDLLTNIDADTFDRNPNVFNYGIGDGIHEAKELFASMLGVSSNEIYVGGNSSLNLMYDTMLKAMYFGMVDSDRPWMKEDTVKFICPVPGYDRHFAICESLGIEMITVDMTPEGPDMDAVEELVKEDASIKGIWCVPKYSNPDGAIYSKETIERLASMETAAKDFKIFYDNAYAVHFLDGEFIEQESMLDACKNADHPNRVIIFASTSKITFPGAGVGVICANRESLDYMEKLIAAQSISQDKVNQLRHVLFLKDFDTLLDHMREQAAILKPKFDIVLDSLKSTVEDERIATWSEPRGGYFISVDTYPGCAKKIEEECAKLGLKITKAGSTYPYYNNPNDNNLRIAPSFLGRSDLVQAMDVFTTVLQKVAIEEIIKNEH
ncbi:aminotransferase class I/II-fold pyridoxal phosphate-dependent enzyme [Phocicoccus schoeneichii]|uniref:Aminotransferase/MSMEI_6121 n=1 Tax=Phocicoccus schoeneichii TaxID=1812261 RepID=A0A6V7RBF3_9BACL|nr:aminotransferase class I/II-fold pyridoxal phosphate-dependent enzyme [Jeotgalicoccus schoeneichii]CAD2074205.1 Putative aminotransferase/MSMEI_6121 [Jeotgalicoccus schoeneichii]